MKSIEKEVKQCISKYNLCIRSKDAIDTLVWYVILGGNLDLLLGNPTFEYLDIFKESRALWRDRRYIINSQCNPF